MPTNIESPAVQIRTEAERLPRAHVSVGAVAGRLEDEPPTVVSLLSRGLVAPEPTTDVPMFVAVAVGFDIIAALSVALPLMLDRALCEARMRPRWDARREVWR